MSSKGKRPMRALTPGDKIDAIQRVNDGESKASVARDIGVPESTLRGWCKNEDKLRYMTSRLSSPDTDKSNDGEPPEKRIRTESPSAPRSPAATGLDLSNPATTTHNAPLSVPPADAPVELTTKRSEPSPPVHLPRERRPDPGASVSMSAISPLSGLGHLPGLTHSHLALSFNEIATNLSLLAQLNPSLSTCQGLPPQPASRALRSVRSPKPGHNGVLNLNETKHRSKSNHSTDPYRQSGSKSGHHHGVSSSSATQPMDDPLWYWLKTQQAMLDLSAQNTATQLLQLPAVSLDCKSNEPNLHPKPVAPVAPLPSHLDYNSNSWLWQYYKQFGGAMTFPEDKLKSASQVPKDKSSDNILYSHLTKSKTGENRTITSPMQNHTIKVEAREPVHVSEEPRDTEHTLSPEVGSENKEPIAEKPSETGKCQTKARNVLDNLLFFSSRSANDENRSSRNVKNWAAGAPGALEHGEEFLAWLETCSDPSVTRIFLQQLATLLHELRTRHVHEPSTSADASRRK